MHSAPRGRIRVVQPNGKPLGYCGREIVRGAIRRCGITSAPGALICELSAVPGEEQRSRLKIAVSLGIWVFRLVSTYTESSSVSKNPLPTDTAGLELGVSLHDTGYSYWVLSYCVQGTPLFGWILAM